MKIRTTHKKYHQNLKVIDGLDIARVLITCLHNNVYREITFFFIHLAASLVIFGRSSEALSVSKQPKKKKPNEP